MTTVMSQQPAVNEEPVFSWENYRAERKKSDKDERRRKSQSKSVCKEKKTKKKSSKKGAKTMDASFSMLDVSQSTEATMMESESTLNSLPEAEQASSSVLNTGLVYDIETDNALDHVVLAAADLDTAIAEFEQKTGVKPVKTGFINGLGITKARVAFEGSSFLEIIAPDPERQGPIGALLQQSADQLGNGLILFHWAIRLSTAQKLSSEVQAPKMGYTPDFLTMKGPCNDGSIKKWDMLYLYGHALGGVCPFFINWDEFDHPCETMPIVGRLLDVKVSAPKDDKIHKLLAHTGSTGFSREENSAAGFEVKFDSPKGEVCFEADKMTGFKIPGFEEMAAQAGKKK